MIIYIAMHWNDDPDVYVKRCFIGEYDPNQEEVDDEGIFYYFDDHEEIVGEHEDFTVIDYLGHVV